MLLASHLTTKNVKLQRNLCIRGTLSMCSTSITLLYLWLMAAQWRHLAVSESLRGSNRLKAVNEWIQLDRMTILRLILDDHLLGLDRRLQPLGAPEDLKSTIWFLDRNMDLTDNLLITWMMVHLKKVWHTTRLRRLSRIDDLRVSAQKEDSRLMSSKHRNIGRSSYAGKISWL